MVWSTNSIMQLSNMRLESKFLVTKFYNDFEQEKSKLARVRTLAIHCDAATNKEYLFVSFY